jgi:DNA replication ATP-dependent helicase Dna2
MRTLEEENICILQGPPGSGKSYTIAQILKHYLNDGKTACVTTMANKGLIELVQQPPLKEILTEGRIAKTNLSADEKRIVKDIKPSVNGLIVPEGELLCSTNYVLSHAFNQEERGRTRIALL